MSEQQLIVAPKIAGADFVMVVMPWALTNQPSLQAGLLCSLLNDADIGTATFYANLEFAGMIGWQQYDEFCSFHNFLGDWLFSEPVFGKFTPQANPNESFDAFAQKSGIDAQELDRIRKLKPIIWSALERCLERVDWSNVKIVGFTTTMLQPLPALAFAKLLACKFPHLKILFGGAGCHGNMGEALHRNFDFIDGVVDGEADKTIVSVVSRILEGACPSGIPGLIWRPAGGVTTSTPPQAVTDLSNYPTPSYDDFFAQSEVSGNPGLRDLRLPFEASRGCWWATRHHCRFCGLNGTTLQQRERPIEAVIAELNHHQKKYGHALFVATDNIISQRHLRALPAAVGTLGAPARLFFEVGAAMSRDRLGGLAAAGVTDVQPGIESLSTDVLQAVDKGTSASLNVCFLRRAEEFGITTHWNLLYGLPGEDPDWYEQMLSWLPLVYHLPPPEPIRFSLQRFSPYFNEPERFGINVLGPMPATRYIWDLPDRELRDLAYDLDFELPGTPDMTETENKITKAVEQWKSNQAPLTLTVQGNGAKIMDHRSGRAEEIVLGPSETAVLAAAEAPVTAERLIATIRRTHPSIYLMSGGSDGLAQATEHLVQNKLLIDIDDRLLALPVPKGPFWPERHHG
mmetsp:Transcript_23190/g.39735  ORF Transcript_23190/g.39735 Transcript_23190/m.39735 type:complete len:628 (+) Transcript_23190:5911-7794(+)